MPTAIELSVLFGLPLKKVQQLCDYLEIELDDPDFDYGKEFETIARAVKRGRSSSSTLAFLADVATEAQREFILNLDDSVRSDYENLDMPIATHELFDKPENLLILNGSMNGENRAEWLQLVEWAQGLIQAAGRSIGHPYLAVRLLLSMPVHLRHDQASTIASVMNKARHRGYLDGWFKLAEIDGKNSVIYSCADYAPTVEKPAPLTEEEVTYWYSQTAQRDPIKLAGFIAFNGKKDFDDVKKFLIEREKKTFDL